MQADAVSSPGPASPKPRGFIIPAQPPTNAGGDSNPCSPTAPGSKQAANGSVTSPTAEAWQAADAMANEQALWANVGRVGLPSRLGMVNMGGSFSAAAQHGADVESGPGSPAAWSVRASSATTAGAAAHRPGPAW